jgi:thioredoxin-like negative regulator of GroEL
MPISTSQTPDVLLFIATGCAHCTVVQKHLGQLASEGVIGQLEVINIATRPELAAEYGVRSVPWYRIGNLELTGARGLEELRQLIAKVNQGQAELLRLEDHLSQRQLDEALQLVKRQPALLQQLIPWLGDLERPFDLRLGIGALLEELKDQAALEQARSPLEALLQSETAQIRADACHYLGITDQQASTTKIRELLQDPDASVREIAAETLALLEDSHSSHPHTANL